ncbi:MAG: Gfo/Idh/MocA family oxidoreductase [Rhodobacteraceae bacterium]|nr:Gfo/Idh/MocA family oxidoreductase [Paracoccaceae bacterium]
MTQPIRWGILGAAKFAQQHMGRAIHAAEGAVLAGLAASSAEKAAPFQAFAPGLELYDSYDALLDDPAIDAVYVPLPNHLHVEWTKKALLAGKHVLTEKPIALNAEEIDELIAARDKAGLLAAEAYMIVHHPQWQRARELYREGAIGKLIHVDGAFSYFNADASNIRNRPETGGGGIRDIGVYPYGATRFVTGEEPERILCANIRWENEVDVYAQVIAQFPSFTLSAMTSMRLHLRQEMVFHGENGILRLTAPFNAGSYGEARLELVGEGQRATVERFTEAQQYVRQVEAFGRSIRDGAPYPWTLEDARGTQRMIDMVFAAA